MAARRKTKLSKLKIRRIQFCSLVDQPAQEPATVRLVKGADGADELAATFRIAKLEELGDELGICFGWLCVAKLDGVPYADLQDDVIDESTLVEAAMNFVVEEDGAVDENHQEGDLAAKAIFVYPLVSSVAKALGLDDSTTGIMIGVKVNDPDVLARVKSGQLGAFSVGGFGDRTPLPEGDSVTEPPGDRAPAPAAASKAAPGGDEDERHIVARMLDHCDGIAANDVEHAFEVAHRNRHSVGKWGQVWIDKHAPRFVEKEARSAAQDLEQASRALAAYVAKRARAAGCDPVVMELALADRGDDVYGQLYADLARAQTVAGADPTAEDLAAVDSDGEAAVAALLDDSAVVAAQDAVNKIVEERALAWNVSMTQAEKRLEEINPPSYQAAKKRFESAYTARHFHNS